MEKTMTDEELKQKVDNNICLSCDRPILDGIKFFCKECYEKSKRHIEENGISKEWDIYSLVLIMGIFGWTEDGFSLEKLKGFVSTEDKKPSTD